MLKMDVGRIFGSLVGQSEENMRKAIRIAESLGLAACGLTSWKRALPEWVEEESVILAPPPESSPPSSPGCRRRPSLSSLIATANDVSALPEPLRKGRFDEIFFIDLPDLKEREEIFNIHLSKRKRDPKKFKVKQLAQATKGFSGAEIEQVVISGLNHAFFDGRELAVKDLMEEANSQVPLSVMMKEGIDDLREWAQLRARPSAVRSEEASKSASPVDHPQISLLAQAGQ